jgi:hypothetical protein
MADCMRWEADFARWILWYCVVLSETKNISRKLYHSSATADSEWQQWNNPKITVPWKTNWYTYNKLYAHLYSAFFLCRNIFYSFWIIIRRTEDDRRRFSRISFPDWWGNDIWSASWLPVLITSFLTASIIRMSLSIGQEKADWDLYSPHFFAV